MPKRCVEFVMVKYILMLANAQNAIESEKSLQGVFVKNAMMKRRMMKYKTKYILQY